MKRLLFIAPVILTFLSLSLNFALAADPIIYPHQTGQSACYDGIGTVISCVGTGQDGEIQMGAAAASTRFTDNGNGTVTDTLTGLVWLKDANCFGSPGGWSSAITNANTLASGACGLTDGSTAGQWRLSNKNELRSLLNYGSVAPLPSGHPFINVVGGDYWSSTNKENNAIRVHLSIGSVEGSWNKLEPWPGMWPVRGGQ